MSNLLYLLVAMAISAGGIGLLMFRHRRPTSVEAGIEEFNRELRALSPERRTPRRPGGGGERESRDRPA